MLSPLVRRVPSRDISTNSSATIRDRATVSAWRRACPRAISIARTESSGVEDVVAPCAASLGPWEPSSKSAIIAPCSSSKASSLLRLFGGISHLTHVEEQRQPQGDSNSQIRDDRHRESPPPPSARAAPRWPPR